jgi:hypothetical protein
MSSAIWLIPIQTVDVSWAVAATVRVDEALSKLQYSQLIGHAHRARV